MATGSIGTALTLTTEEDHRFHFYTCRLSRQAAASLVPAVKCHCYAVTGEHTTQRQQAVDRLTTSPAAMLYFFKALLQVDASKIEYCLNRLLPQ